MFTKNKIFIALLAITFFTKISFAQCTDTRYYIQTPRGSSVPDTYQTCEMSSGDRAY